MFIIPIKIDGQPDSRFQSFDWVLHHAPGSINSITEGYSYCYIATQNGGLKRFNLYNLTFEDPLTIAQGLKDNLITSCHFDLETGYIWASTPKHIQYSFSREGDWYSIELEKLGISKYNKIEQIGSSIGYVWLKLRNSYAKINHTSGALIGIYSKPDEVSINWSSGPYSAQTDLVGFFLNYTISDGWLVSEDDFIDKLGRRVAISTGFIGKYGNIYAGSEDGTFFHGSKTMETFTPLVPDIINFGISAIYHDGNSLWIGSNDFIFSKGISSLNTWTNEIGTYFFEETINMTPSPIFSLNVTDNELWAGGESLLLFYNKKKDFWRTLGEERGVPSGQIWDLHRDDSHIWIAASNGLGRLDIATKKEDPIGIEHLFSGTPIYDIEEYDNQIWIGARSGIFVYSTKSPQLRHGGEVARKSFPEIISRVTTIKEVNGFIYITGDMGIAKLNFDSNEWELVFNSVVYQNRFVNCLAINGNNIFLGTKDGIIRINEKTGFVQDYLFDFIGPVNELIIEDTILWAGTNNGLIKFKWKKDL